MSAVTLSKSKAADMAYIALFAVLIAICSWISIPAMVPFTLQTFGVFLAVGVLGGKRGTLSVVTYLLLGAVGVPVFTGFSGGIGHIFGGTGGYIVGFLLSALVLWGMEHFLGRKKWVLVLSMLLGLLACYVFGTFWFMRIFTNNAGDIGLWTALVWCVFPYIVPDILKILLALTVCKKIARVIRIN